MAATVHICLYNVSFGDAARFNESTFVSVRYHIRLITCNACICCYLIMFILA
jgi:hypothetical protein